MSEVSKEELKNPVAPTKEEENTVSAGNKVEEMDFEELYSDILQEFGPNNHPHQTRKKTAGHTGASHKPKNGKSHHKKKKKKKSLKGLVITLCLELAGIVGIILWWLLRIL